MKRVHYVTANTVSIYRTNKINTHTRSGPRWRMRNMPVSHAWLIAAVNKSFINITLCQYERRWRRGASGGCGSEVFPKTEAGKTNENILWATFRLAFPIERGGRGAGGGRPKGNYVNMALMHATRPSASSSSCVYNLISNNARGCVCVFVCVCVYSSVVSNVVLMKSPQLYYGQMHNNIRDDWFVFTQTQTHSTHIHTHTRAWVNMATHSAHLLEFSAGKISTINQR